MAFSSNSQTNKLVIGKPRTTLKHHTQSSQ
jgi:hypothetical protein